MLEKAAKTGVRLIGAAPFTGKYQVRHYYTDGLRAVARGDIRRLSHNTRNLLRIIKANAFLGGLATCATGLALAADGPRSPLEAGVCGAIAVGHFASAAAEIWLRRDVTRRAEAHPADHWQRQEEFARGPAHVPPLWREAIHSGPIITAISLTGGDAISRISNQIIG